MSNWGIVPHNPSQTGVLVEPGSVVSQGSAQGRWSVSFDSQYLWPENGDVCVVHICEDINNHFFETSSKPLGLSWKIKGQTLLFFQETKNLYLSIYLSYLI